MVKTKFITPLQKITLGSALTVLVVSLSAISSAADYEGPVITFEQIYENPSDQDLNLNYARQQAQSGDFISAAGTLERLLFAEPNWDSARLYYALVLFKLDDRNAAMEQLDILDGRPLSSDQRRQVALYRDGFTGVDSESKESKFTGRIVAGVRWDDNAGNALADNTLAIANQDDTAAFLQGAVNFSAPLGTGDKLTFRAGLNGQTLRHKTFSLTDYDTIGANIGISGKSGNWKWALDGQAVNIYISGAKYLTQIGPKLSVSSEISPGVKLTLSGAYYDQNYDDLSFTFGETARSGDKIVILAAIQKKLSPKTIIGGSTGFENKDAANNNFAYDAFRIGVNFRTKFDNGMYLKARASYRKLNYDAQGILAIDREDDHIGLRLSLGSSLSDLGIGIENIGIEGGVIYVNRGSNINGLDYENVGLELKFIYDF